MAEKFSEMDSLRASLESLENTIFGNGEPGLKSQVQVIDQKVTNGLARLDIQDRRADAQDERLRKNEKMMAYLIGGLYLLSVVSALFIKFWK